MSNLPSDELIYQALINGKTIDVSQDQLNNLDLVSTLDGHHLIVDGNSYRIKVLNCDFQHKNIQLEINGRHMSIDLRNQTDRTVSEMGLDTIVAPKLTKLISPMPGHVLDILVQEGDVVKEGDHLVILEAMKMENVLKAHHDALIKTVHVIKGDTVNKNSVLIDFDQ